MVGYRPPDTFLQELERIRAGRNTLPVLLNEFEKDPTRFRTLFTLANKYEKKGDILSAKLMVDAILEAGTDSAGTAEFYSILYNAREARDPQPLVQYADAHPDGERVVKSLREAMYILRREKKEPELEASLYIRLINLSDKPSPNECNSFAWRMSQLEIQLEMALDKVTWAVANAPDENQKYMFIDTKAEVLWKMGRVDEAILEIQKCRQGKPEDDYYRKQEEKFRQSMNT